MSPYEEFWAAVTDRGRRGCWGCELRPSEREECARQSGGVLDGHHILPKAVLKREFPHGAYIYEDGSVDRVLAAHRRVIPAGATEVNGVRVVDLAVLLADPRNGVPLARLHHDRIEQRIFNPTREQLPAGVEAFAAEFELTWWLDRRYGLPEVTDLRRVAATRRHLDLGMCPDMEDPADRDPGCPVCVALGPADHEKEDKR